MTLSQRSFRSARTLFVRHIPTVTSLANTFHSRPSFPLFRWLEMDNSVDNRAIDNGDIENAVNVMYQVDVYSNLNTGKKAQTKAIIALLDEVLAGYRFVRTFCNPVQNFNDATIYRMTARYTRRITNQDEIYKED